MCLAAFVTETATRHFSNINNTLITFSVYMAVIRNPFSLYLIIRIFPSVGLSGDVMVSNPVQA